MPIWNKDPILILIFYYYIFFLGKVFIDFWFLFRREYLAVRVFER